MKIELISKEQFNQLLAIQKNHPVLTFQNEGYEYIDKSKFTPEDKEAFELIELILNNHIIGFSKFNNFCHSKKGEGELRLRFQYNWTADDDTPQRSFIGVGYMYLSELLNGFSEK